MIGYYARTLQIQCTLKKKNNSTHKDSMFHVTFSQRRVCERGRVWDSPSISRPYDVCVSSLNVESGPWGVPRESNISHRSSVSLSGCVRFGFIDSCARVGHFVDDPIL